MLFSVRITRAAVLVVLVLVAAGCGEPEDPRAPATTTPAPTATATPTDTDPATSPTPTGPAPDEAPTTRPPAEADIDEVELAAELVAEREFTPTLTTAPPGEDGLWVLDQGGTVLVFPPDGGTPRTFLEIRDQVTAGGERGLLGLAFAPGYPDDDPRVFVHYTGQDGRTVLSEFTTSGDPREVDEDSETRLLTVPQPAPNHNGGTVTFGPDGLLYLALGDGGGSGDTYGNGQDPGTLLGAVLRLDVSTAGEYAIPPENPFSDGEGGAPEVFAYGLRNPYRIAFGPDGTLYIADVGQNQVEELNALHYTEAAGANFGWPVLEGTSCFRSEDCDRSEYVLPVVEYTHADTGGCSIIGGEVYTGDRLPALRGHYFYSDLCAGFLRSIRFEDGAVVDHRDWTEQVGPFDRVVAIGRDAAGELYVTEHLGRVLRLVGG